MNAVIDYRWMRPEDGEALARLHRRAILLVGVRAYSPEIARSWAFGLRPDGYAEAATRGEAIEIAEMFGAPVGFCATKADEIKGLYVDPGFMRLGVASSLMLRALARLAAEGHGEARVMAALSGVDFYEAMGFRTARGRLHPTRGGLGMPMLEMARPLLAEPPYAARAMTLLRPEALAS